MKKGKIVALVCAAALCFSAFAGCVQDNRELATVNGEAITSGEFKFYLENMKELLIQQLGLDIEDESSWSTVEIENRKAIDVAKEKALDDAVGIMIQVQKAEQEGITLTEDDKAEVRRQKSSLIQQYGGESAFNDKLSQWQISSSNFDEILQDYKLASKLKDKLVAEDPELSEVSDNEVQEEYDKAIEEVTNSALHVKHILILFQPENGEVRDEVTTQALAQEALDKINAGEDFEAVLAEYNEDSGQPEDGYNFTHNDGTMVQEFDDASYALGVGDVSGLVKTSYGYHIIKRYPFTQELPSLDEVRDQLISSIQSVRYTDRVSQWKQEAEIVKNDAVYNEIQ